MIKIKDYHPIVGDKVVDEILSRAKKFKNKRIVCVSSVSQGGGGRDFK